MAVKKAKTKSIVKPKLEIKDKILKELDRLRPYLQSDGGDVEFHSFDEPSGELKLIFRGACSGCPMSEITLHQGIEQALKAKLPAVKSVMSV